MTYKLYKQQFFPGYFYCNEISSKPVKRRKSSTKTEITLIIKKRSILKLVY